MGKIIKLSESQMRKLLGDNFVSSVLKEDNNSFGSGFGAAQSAGKRPYDVKPGEGRAKMTNLGHTVMGGEVKNPNTEHPENEVGLPETKNDFINSVIKYIYKENGGPVNILDALEIIGKLQGKNISSEIRSKGVEIGDDVKNFLDMVDISTILSNYLIIDQPDYVYYRLSKLSPEEIARIKKTYNRDFSNWGKKCDGCGLEVWKTNVFTNSGDDAHINLEYMGSAGKSSDGTNLGEMKTYRIPFQIHHMNEVPTDNSPLNLSCLCPNCHSLTGSYAKNHSTGLTVAELENLVKSERNSEEENDEIARNIGARLSHGNFLDTSLSDKMNSDFASAENISTQEIDECVNQIISLGKQWFRDNISGENIETKWDDTEFKKTNRSEPRLVSEVAGLKVYASFLSKSKKTLFVTLYTDPNDERQTSNASNMRSNPIEIPVVLPQQGNKSQEIADKQKNEYLRKQISLFIFRALKNKVYGGAELSRADFLSNSGGDKIAKNNKLAKERDVDNYNAMEKKSPAKLTDRSRKVVDDLSSIPDNDVAKSLAKLYSKKG